MKLNSIPEACNKMKLTTQIVSNQNGTLLCFQALKVPMRLGSKITS